VHPNAKDRQDPEGCTFAFVTLMIVQTREIELNESHFSVGMTDVPLKKKHVGLEGNDM
jgi:hypothetical protein